MELKELKKLVLFAKKQGVKSISVQGVTLEFFETQTVLFRKPRAAKTSTDSKDGVPLTPPEVIPTLDQINRFIYEEKAEEIA